jgi:hypothetical protein
MCFMTTYVGVFFANRVSRSPNANQFANLGFLGRTIRIKD